MSYKNCLLKEEEVEKIRKNQVIELITVFSSDCTTVLVEILCGDLKQAARATQNVQRRESESGPRKTSMHKLFQSNHTVQTKHTNIQRLHCKPPKYSSLPPEVRTADRIALSIQFYLHRANSQQQMHQGALYCKVKALQY